ncbi:aminoglycoside phosphotransferase family protein [Nocardia sp. NPDC057668]|uniref:aminoglycoside phosphotransferase family protein n=1 Tax=Nocardia sp. NPDC057668 TaxID=3346202 RepID=UPI00366D6B6B
MHPNQLEVSLGTVRALVDEQFPQWRGLDIRHAPGSGTVHSIFRLGDDLALRFRMRFADPVQVRSELHREAAAAREVVGRTRFATPEPVAIGEPGGGYPLPWSIQTWLEGEVALDADPGESSSFAMDLAEFIIGVRSIDARGRTFDGNGRGGDLRSHDDWVATCLTRSNGLLDVVLLRHIWERLRTLPRGSDPDVMNHCDLIPGNILVADGRLTGVLDTGGLAAADPALDLVSAWHLLGTASRQVLRDRLDVDNLEWERGRAWAFQQAIGLVWYYADSNPALSRVGRKTLDRIVSGA